MRSDMAGRTRPRRPGATHLRFFDPQMPGPDGRARGAEADMRAGLDSGQFELFYQPKMVRGQITGAEALLRWRHPVKGYVSRPNSFRWPSNGPDPARANGCCARPARRLAHWQEHPVLAS